MTSSQGTLRRPRGKGSIKWNIITIDSFHSLLEEGGDWDRRNRLKTYHGLYAMSIRDFKMAATYFFETMATFTSTELMEYRAFVKYAVFCCMVAMDRSDLKEKVWGCGW